VLPSGKAVCFYAEKVAQRGYDRVQYRDTWDLQTPAAFEQRGPKVLVDKGEHHDAWVFLQLGQQLYNLSRGSDQGPVMFDRLRALELSKTGSRNAVNRLACSVGHEVKVKFHDTEPPYRAVLSQSV
jgi:hypothetical protein